MKFSYPILNLNKSINYLFIFLAFVLPLSKAGIAFFSALILILWFFDKKFRETSALVHEPIIQIFLLFLFYKVFTITYSQNISASLEHLRGFWYYALLPVFLISVQKDFVQKILSAFLLGMLVSEIISYGIYFGFWTTRWGTPMDPTPFMNHLNYSLFLSITALIVLGRIIVETSIKKRFFYILFFITATTNLFLTGGRSGQLAFLFGIFILFLYRTKYKIRAAFGSIFLIMLILFSSYNLSPTFKQRTQNAISDLQQTILHTKYNTSWGTRISEWVIVKEILQQSPLFGIGIGDIHQYYYHAVNSDENLISSLKSEEIHSGFHSDLAEMLAGGGIIGGVLLLSIFIVLAKTHIKNFEIDNLRVILTTVYIVGFIADPFLRGHFTGPLFVLMTGLIFIQHKNESL